MKILLVLFLGLTVTTSPPARATDAQTLYDDYCSVCHGDMGDGNSHARQGMQPPPRDFTSPAAAIELSRQRIVHAIREGVPGTAMSAWKSRLDETQIAALADLIKNRFMLSSSPSEGSEGSEIYAAYCSVCHGDNGKGALWASAGLSSRPADFTDAGFQVSMTREHMIQSVTFGRPETAMAGWQNRLSERQIAVVVDYVVTAFMPDFEDQSSTRVSLHKHADGSDHLHADPGTDLALYLQKPLTDGLEGDAARGAELYRNNCATCHGDKGDGRGPRAYFINPKPRNFLHAASRAALNRPTLHRVISKGKLRTEMPAWEKVLDPQQIADLSEFVFTRFIQP